MEIPEDKKVKIGGLQAKGRSFSLVGAEADVTNLYGENTNQILVVDETTTEG